MNAWLYFGILTGIAVLGAAVITLVVMFWRARYQLIVEAYRTAKEWDEEAGRTEITFAELEKRMAESLAEPEDHHRSFPKDGY